MFFCENIYHTVIFLRNILYNKELEHDIYNNRNIINIMHLSFLYLKYHTPVLSDAWRK